MKRKVCFLHDIYKYEKIIFYKLKNLINKLCYIIFINLYMISHIVK